MNLSIYQRRGTCGNQWQGWFYKKWEAPKPSSKHDCWKNIRCDISAKAY